MGVFESTGIGSFDGSFDGSKDGLIFGGYVETSYGMSLGCEIGIWIGSKIDAYDVILLVTRIGFTVGNIQV